MLRLKFQWSNVTLLIPDPILAVNKTDNENETYTENWKQLPELTIRAFEYANTHFGNYHIHSSPLFKEVTVEWNIQWGL